MSQQPTSDEALKKQVNGGDARECMGVMDVSDDEMMQQHLSKGYFIPTIEQLNDSRIQIESFSQNNLVVIPLHEENDIIGGVLGYLRRFLKPEQIVVVNDRSSDTAVREVKRYGVIMVNRDEILSLLDWNQLHVLTNTKEIPVGKGMCVMAGYLATYILYKTNGWEQPEWIFQCDAEVRQSEIYRAYEHLVWGILNYPQAIYTKLAKWGRFNEICMGARNLLGVIAQQKELNQDIRTRASKLFQRLVSHKWMLCGEFGMNWDAAMDRPFASAYLDETLISSYITGPMVQVANEQRRLDGANSDHKEWTMQQVISSFLIGMAMNPKILVEKIDLEGINALNNGAFSNPFTMGWFPSDERPVQAAKVHFDRFFPSVKIMDEEGLINWGKAEKLVEKL